jgi:hypothetical protein
MTYIVHVTQREYKLPTLNRCYLCPQDNRSVLLILFMVLFNIHFCHISYSAHQAPYPTLVICLIPLLNTQVKHVKIQINIWKNQFFFDGLPNDPGMNKSKLYL